MTKNSGDQAASALLPLRIGGQRVEVQVDRPEDLWGSTTKRSAVTALPAIAAEPLGLKQEAAASRSADADKAVVVALRFDTRRDTQEAEQDLELAATDLVELHYADGFVLWTTGAQIAADLAQKPQASATRGEATASGLLAPSDLSVLRGNEQQRRGGAAAPLGLVRYRLDPEKASWDRADQAAAEAEGLYRVPRGLRKGMARGDFKHLSLDRLAPTPQASPAETSTGAGATGTGAPAPVKPCLLLIHGTFSSLSGSYGALGMEATRADGGNLTPLARLHSQYDQQVYAYEHATVSRSVFENLARLAGKLDPGLVLDLVSFSRGGLIAELLVRSELDQPFDLRDAQLTAGMALGRAAAFRAATSGAPALRQALDEGVSNWWQAALLQRLVMPEVAHTPIESEKARAAAAGDKASAGALREALLQALGRNGVALRKDEELQTSGAALARMPAATLDAAVNEVYWLALARQELVRARPRIRRQVRVAAPISGTSLADGRLDRWVSTLINLSLTALQKGAETASGLSNDPLLQSLFDSLRALVAEGIDVERVRGLASMRSGNAATLLATDQSKRVGQHKEARLLVLSSDFSAGDGWAAVLQSGLDWLSERFFGGPNDLVVNTRAMSAGLPRPRDRSWARHFRRDSLVHINYFTFAEICDALLRGLADEAPAETPLRSGVAEARVPAMARRAADPARPLVLLIPGIGGSELLLDGRKVWIDYLNLACGDDLAALAAGRGTVTPGRVSAAYQALIDHLDYTGFEVEPFAYDWSGDLFHAARGLAVRVAELKERAGPLHLVAHSSGGLLLRMLAAAQPALWRELQSRGGRAVMLGTPNNGSWAALELLAGNSRVIRSLAQLQPWQDDTALRRCFAQMNGVLQLLPPLDPALSHAGLAFVDSDRVAEAIMRRGQLADSVAFQRSVAYIAGQAANTPDGTDSGTPDGDGRVLWSTGPLAEQPVRFAGGVSHGNLISDPLVLGELSGYLRDGTWSRLQSAKPPAPSLRSDGSEPEARQHAIDTLPPAQDLVTALYGGSGETGRRAEYLETPTAAGRIVVTTTHGSLVHAIYPIVLGHHSGEGLYSTERTLDERLEGRLSESLRLRLYPGAIGSAQVFLDDSRRPTGAVVIGLGEVGGLTPAHLRQSFSRGVRELSQALFQQQVRADYANGFDLYTVLIGSSIDALSITESVESILRGALDANAEIDRGNEPRNPRQLRSYPRLGRLHFIELWADRAHLIRSELQGLAGYEEFRERVQLAPGLVAGRGRQQRLFAQEDAGWWRRLLIQCDGRGFLRFKSLTDRARMMSLVRPTQAGLVTTLLEQMTESGAHDPQLGRTLHELLMPNEFKERHSDERPVVFVLDEHSAGYPWELLIDPRSPDGQARSVRHGLIRQLKTARFTDPPQAEGRDILVIGDTDSGLAALPGASVEAVAVARAFRSASGWPDAVLLNRPRAAELLNRLFERPWRVLHVAAHGVHDQRAATCVQCGAGRDELTKGGCPVVRCNPRKYCANEPRSGVVLGAGLYLTPTEISQMRSVPELVFLNCCHLGKSDGNQLVSGLSRLGANLATQLIRMGVRAVVAAGWAVNDKAAELFARTFYDQLLAGNTFGDAVREARRACARQFPRDNTWGAYQCYGDPAWRFDENGRSTPGVTHWRSDPHAAEIELSNLQRRGEVCRLAELEDERARFVKLLQDVEAGQPQWLHQAEVAGARARAALALALDELVPACLEQVLHGTAVTDAMMQRTRVESAVRAALAQRCGAAASPAAAEMARELRQKRAESKAAGAGVDLSGQIKLLTDQLRALPDDGDSPGEIERRRLLLRLHFAQAWAQRDVRNLEQLRDAARGLVDAHPERESDDRVRYGLRDLRLNNARLYYLGASLLLALRKDTAQTGATASSSHTGDSAAREKVRPAISESQERGQTSSTERAGADGSARESAAAVAQGATQAQRTESSGSVIAASDAGASPGDSLHGSHKEDAKGKPSASPNDAASAREDQLSDVRTEIQKSLDTVRERAEDRNDYRFIAHAASLRILMAVASETLDRACTGPGQRSERLRILDDIGATLDRGVPHVQLQRSIDWVAFIRDLHPDAPMRESLHLLYLDAYRRLDQRGEARLLIWRARPPADDAQPVVAGAAPASPVDAKADGGAAGADTPAADVGIALARTGEVSSSADVMATADEASAAAKVESGTTSKSKEKTKARAKAAEVVADDVLRPPQVSAAPADKPPARSRSGKRSPRR